MSAERTRRRRRPRPAAALAAAVTLAASGILMAPIAPALTAGLSIAMVAYMFVVDLLEVAVFTRVRLA